ncbi:hypothetical protein [Stackebrandtia albiflava]|uniref:hypothetical protein n=1 Tax=Stackebrandtia albiflava TaxID=406432 RepID=UPI0011BF9C32|nr:hypothetical protein [Stackebrandtia albiflava]
MERLLAVAEPDAARWPGVPRGVDVPLSVWAHALGFAELQQALVRDLSQRGDLVVTTLSAGWKQVPITGRRVVLLCRRQEVQAARTAWEGLDTSAQALSRVEPVTSENLSTRLVNLAGSAQLLTTDAATTRSEAFWSAARTSLAPGGVVAVACAGGNAAAHARMIREAVSAGMAYVQHVIATSAPVLDAAVSAWQRAIAAPIRRHRRAHLDVFLFTTPGTAPRRGEGR